MNIFNGKTISPPPNLQLSSCHLEGVRVVTPPTIFEDFRGTYVETFNEDLYRQAGIDMPFVQDDISVSGRHVLRGIHGDQKPGSWCHVYGGSFIWSSSIGILPLHNINSGNRLRYQIAIDNRS